jgi:predicted DNA-binding transcriptional regulator YafY
MVLATLSAAIEQRRVVHFRYEQSLRVVEPYLIGETRRGNLVLSAFWVDGYSSSGSRPEWRQYVLDKVTALEVLEERFVPPRPGYDPRDRRMRRIVCRVER